MNKTETCAIYLVATMSEYSEQPIIYITNTDMTAVDGVAVLDTKEITFDVPDIAIVNGELAVSLEAKKTTMQATATAAIAEVECQIQSLLAIEHVK